MINNTDKRQLSEDFTWGMLLAMVSKMVDYEIDHGKREYLDRLSILVNDFIEHLSESDKQVFQENITNHISTKIALMKDKLSEVYSPQEIEELVEALKESPMYVAK